MELYSGWCKKHKEYTNSQEERYINLGNSVKALSSEEQIEVEDYKNNLM